MELSEFVLRIAFLALPGLVGSKLYRKLRGPDTESKTWQDFTEVLLFALLSYVILAGLFALSACCRGEVAGQLSVTDPNLGVPELPAGLEQSAFWDRVSVIGAVFDSTRAVNLSEILFASLIGLLLGVCASFVHKTNALMRFFQRIGVTRRFGDEDVWEFFLCSPDTDEWLFVRDHKTDVVYYGAVTQYSESKRERELVIENASVHSVGGEWMYDCRALYVSRARDALTVELPDFERLQATRTQEADKASDAEKGHADEQQIEAGKQSGQ